MSSYLPHTERAKRNITMTFRLDENVIATLRAESDRRHISLNTMVNQIYEDT